MMKLRKRNFVIALIVGIIIVFFLVRACTNSKLSKKAPISVAISRVVQKDVIVYATAIGNVQPYSTVNIKSQVDGRLLSVGFKEGDMVRAKQLLFSIDPQAYQIALEQAEANMARDKALLETAKSALKRNQPLLGKGYVSKQDFDTIKNNLNSLFSTLKADQAAVDKAKLQLSHCSIYAPIDGRTGNLLVKPGNLVNAEDTSPLVIINQITPIYVSFNITEDNLDNIQRILAKKSIDILISPSKDQENYTIKGPLTFIDNGVDITTGTIQLKATLPNKDLLLWPGQYVKVKIPIDLLTKALLVPANAIQTGPNGTYVFIVDQNNHAKIKMIRIGADISSETVVEGGLVAGDRVITAGHMLLTEGALVNPTNESTK